MSLSYTEELELLLQLIVLKGYRRDGCVLYAKYENFKPECTISEMVWGHCHNPCFARRLTRELSNMIPDYTQIMSKLNQTISSDTIFGDFDQAMRALSRAKRESGLQQHVAFSLQSTHPHDCFFEDEETDRLISVFNASDEDGELWHGLVVDEAWADGVESVNVSIHSSEQGKLWEHDYSHSSVVKRVRQRNDVFVFEPFRNAMPILALDMKIVVRVVYLPYASSVDAVQLFGIGTDEFCHWIDDSCFEIKLCKANEVVLLNMPEHTIKFVSK